jgi:hypothetical protein
MIIDKWKIIKRKQKKNVKKSQKETIQRWILNKLNNKNEI